MKGSKVRTNTEKPNCINPEITINPDIAFAGPSTSR